MIALPAGERRARQDGVQGEDWVADWIDKLTELRRQKEAGLIDAAAFDVRRAEILADRDAARPARPPPPFGNETPAGIGSGPDLRSTEVQPAASTPAMTSVNPFLRFGQATENSAFEPSERPPSPQSASIDDTVVSIVGPPLAATGVLPAADAGPTVAAAPSQPAAGATQAPTFTPPPATQTSTTERRPNPQLLIFLGGAALVAAIIGLVVVLPRTAGDRSGVGPAVTSGDFVQSPPGPSTEAASSAAPSPAIATSSPVILSGAVATSDSVDATQTPSFTAVLSARYDGAGPQDQIVASLWKGRTKVGNCGSGVTSIPSGSYRCEWNQLTPGAYEFHAGFPGTRQSTFRFNLTARAPVPAPTATAQAETPAPPPAVIVTNPEWIRRPTAEDVSRFYPNTAMLSGVEGSTRITCRVSVTGQLVGCVVQFETPLGYGFGAAALRLSSTLRMRPMMRNGEPVDGATVTVPIRWQLQ